MAASKFHLPVPPGTDPLRVPREAAAYLRSTESTMAKQRMNGTGPDFIKLGRLVRYRQSALDAYLDRHTKKSTADAA